MARISTYVNDTTVSGQDKLLGSDSTEATRNFPISSLAGYLDNSGSITVSDQLNLKFITVQDDVSNATFFKDGFGGNNSNINSLGTILVSKNDALGNSLAEYTNKIFKRKINIIEVGNKNNFATFSVASIVTDVVYTNFFRVSLQFVEGNGLLSRDKYYSFSILAGDEAKTYVHVQGTAESTWDVTHNLEKKPSVTVVDSTDNVVIGEVEYLTINSVRLKFAGAFSGKAYFN
jgi:hypothetical protein